MLRKSSPVRRLALAALLGAAVFAVHPSGALASKADNSIVVGLGTDFVNGDPANGAQGDDFPVLYTLYDRLIDFNPSDMTLRPMLATDWAWSDDHLTLTLTLRQGVKFHDGTDFDAEAVKKSIEFFIKSGLNHDVDDVTDIKVIDPYTVAITTKAVNSSLPGQLAERAGMILSPAGIDKYGKEGYADHPVGTGPFKWVRHDVGNAVFVEKFEDYWNQGEPKLDRIEFRVLKNPASAVSAVMTGQIDYLPNVDPVNMEAMKRNPNVRVETEPTVGLGVINLNHSLEPTNKPKVRKAIAISIDGDAIARAVYGDSIKTVGANLPVPPGYWPSTPELEKKAYDPEGAKKLLAEAGYPDGLTFHMCLNANAGMPQPSAKVAEIMRDQLKASGITLQLTTMASNSACSPLLRSTIPGSMLTWSGRPDPAINYAQMLGTTSFYNVGAETFGNADEVIQRMQNTFDKEEQDKIFDELNKLWTEYYPMIPTYYFVKVAAYSAGLAGEQPNLLGRPYVRTFHWE